MINANRKLATNWIHLKIINLKFTAYFINDVSHGTNGKQNVKAVN